MVKGSNKIPSVNATLASPAVLTANHWGVAVSGLNDNFNFDFTSDANLNTAKFAGIPTSQTTDRAIMSQGNPSADGGDRQAVYYGVMVNTREVQAGEYQGKVQYTATANLPAPAVVDSISPDNYKKGETRANGNQVTIKGKNLASTYEVFVDANGNGVKDDGEAAEITSVTDDTIVAKVPTALAAGTYKVYLTTQASPSPVQVTDAFHYYELRNICTNELCVTYDQQMIPVKYTGNDTNAQWSVVTDEELKTPSNWFQYDSVNKKWANAVTVKADKLQTYLDAEKGNNTKFEVKEDDILGYWVYIPRYAYEVKRYQASDKFVPAENFAIHFEKADTTKKIPATSCNELPNQITKAEMWSNGTANNDASNIKTKDYRTGCGISRTYGAATGTTWATHPAFTYGDQELNGFWMGKFELTGSRNYPTVKPNRTANISENVGQYWNTVKSIAVDDPDNPWQTNSATKPASLNSHSLTILTANVAKNDQWGAATYLSASQYGAGVGKVYNNAAKIWNCNGTLCKDDDGQAVTSCDDGGSPATTVDCYSSSAKNNYGGNRTGCGPNDANGSVTAYDKCDVNSDKSYQGKIGQLASTTNNVYGVYDMAGGDWDYVASNLSDHDDQTATGLSSYTFAQPAGSKYVDIKRKSTGYDEVTPWAQTNGGLNKDPSLLLKWTVATGNQYWVYRYNNDFCTWEDCGGEALHETKNIQSVTDWNQSWNSDYADFSFASATWLERGGRVGDGSGAGVFASNDHNGWGNNYHSARAVLAGR